MDGLQAELDWATVVAEARKLRDQSRELRQKVAATIEQTRRIVGESQLREWLWKGGGKWPLPPE
jgi:uncharacterized coiled-coil DUF342 family protein